MNVEDTELTGVGFLALDSAIPASPRSRLARLSAKLRACALAKRAHQGGPASPKRLPAADGSGRRGLAKAGLPTGRQAQSEYVEDLELTGA